MRGPALTPATRQPPRVGAICSLPDCNNSHSARGWCRKHYKRWQRHGDPNILMQQKSCSMSDCPNKHVAVGYCWKHYQRARRHGDPNIILKPRSRKPLTASPAMIHAYESGLLIKEIAKRFDLHRNRVGRALRRADAKRVFCPEGHELAVVGRYRNRCKLCRDIRVRNWQETNREKMLAYMRAYYLEHRDELLAYSRKRYDALRTKTYQPRTRRRTQP